MNFVYNHLMVQFTHRMVAYLLVGLVTLHAIDCARNDSGLFRAGALVLAAMLLVQAILGIATLVSHVPISLALIHQAVAIIALIVATVHAGNLRAVRTSSAARDEWKDQARARQFFMG